MEPITIKNPVDLKALRASAKAIEEQILETKAALHEPWAKPMADAQYRLLSLKDEATAHYVLRALLRSKAHLKRVPKHVLERHLSAAEKLATKFRRAPRPEEAVDFELASRERGPNLVRRLWSRVSEAVGHAVG